MIFGAHTEISYHGNNLTSPSHLPTFLFLSPPSSKCLHLFNALCFLYLHCEHSILNTTFFVVLAYQDIMHKPGLARTARVLCRCVQGFHFHSNHTLRDNKTKLGPGNDGYTGNGKQPTCQWPCIDAIARLVGGSISCTSNTWCQHIIRTNNITGFQQANVLCQRYWK